MFLNSRVFAALLSILFLWTLILVVSLRIEKREVAKDQKNVEVKISEIGEDNESLEKFLKYFENPLFVEKEARSRLNYKEAGEEVVFVHRDLNSKQTSPSDEFSITNFSGWLKWIFKRD